MHSSETNGERIEADIFILTGMRTVDSTEG